MPFASEAQRRWMWANHPEMAAEWEKETPSGKLPKKIREGAENAEDDPADPTVATLNRILAGGEHETIPGIPVFDEHDEYDEKGKVVRKFDKKKLAAIAEATNAREAQTGDMALSGPGHTIDGAPETAQPPPWGFYRNFRVGTFGPKKITALLADLVVRKDKKDEALSYPRRSIELWTKDNVIDWVAHLRRTPERDLGLLAYSKDHGVHTPGRAQPLYSDATKRRQLAAQLSPSGKLRYAMEANVSDATNTPDNDPDFDRFCAMMDRYMAKHHAKYAAGPGFGGSPGFVPTQVAPAASAPAATTPIKRDDDAERVQRLQRDAELLRFSRMEAQLAELNSQVNRRDAEIAVRTLMAEGHDLDVSAELEQFSRLDPAGREARANHIRRYHRKDPTGGGWVQLAADPVGKARETNKEERDRAVSYATRNGVSYDEALKITREQ